MEPDQWSLGDIPERGTLGSGTKVVIYRMEDRLGGGGMADGSFRQITDFKRPTLIARQVSWSPDGKSIYAAVVDIDADSMSFDGLLP